MYAFFFHLITLQNSCLESSTIFAFFNLLPFSRYQRSPTLKIYDVYLKCILMCFFSPIPSCTFQADFTLWWIFYYTRIIFSKTAPGGNPRLSAAIPCCAQRSPSPSPFFSLLNIYDFHIIVFILYNFFCFRCEWMFNRVE